jgi:hypothetical protein
MTYFVTTPLPSVRTSSPTLHCLQNGSYKVVSAHELQRLVIIRARLRFGNVDDGSDDRFSEIAWINAMFKSSVAS